MTRPEALTYEKVFFSWHRLASFFGMGWHHFLERFTLANRRKGGYKTITLALFTSHKFFRLELDMSCAIISWAFIS